MDPDEALKQMRALIALMTNELDKLEDDHDYSALENAANEAIDVFNGLDQWMSHRGFPPRAWERR